MLGGLHSIDRAGGSRYKCYELVAAQAGNHGGVLQRMLQPAGELTQELVAGVVAERVVDLLEAIHVD